MGLLRYGQPQFSFSEETQNKSNLFIITPALPNIKSQSTEAKRMKPKQTQVRSPPERSSATHPRLRRANHGYQRCRNTPVLNWTGPQARLMGNCEYVFSGYAQEYAQAYAAAEVKLHHRSCQVKAPRKRRSFVLSSAGAKINRRL